MLPTEDEARKRWCPMARYMTGADNRAAGNRPFDGHPGTLCIASDCMMWRWVGEERAMKNIGNTTTVYERGYCGLAGRG